MPVIDSTADNCVDVIAIDDRTVVLVGVDLGYFALRCHSPRIARFGIVRVRSIDIAYGDDIAKTIGASAIAYSLATTTDHGNPGTFIRRISPDNRTAGKNS